MKRRTFDRAFKMATIKMVLDENIPVITVAEELSIQRESSEEKIQGRSTKSGMVWRYNLYKNWS